MANSSDIDFKPVVTFCCLSYKHGAYLKYCIDSIINQDYKHIEIIAMDDGSPDDSGKILSDYAKNSSFPIKVIIQSNTGNVAKNFSTLASHATGSYISFIAMDDFIEKDSITSKIGFFEKNQNIVFVANKLNNKVDENNNYIIKDESVLDWSKEVFSCAEELLEVEYKHMGAFYIQGAIFKKSIFDEVGGFDDDLLGDDIILRTKFLKYMMEHPELKFMLMDKAAVNYRMHDNNIHQNSLRQIKIVKQWKDRYFPDREAPAKIFEWMKHSYDQNRSSGNIKNCSELLNILADLIEKKPREDKNLILDSFFRLNNKNIYHKKYFYFIPFFFYLRYIKFDGEKKIVVNLFGIKLVDIVRSKKENIRKLRVKFLYIKIYEKVTLRRESNNLQ